MSEVVMNVQAPANLAAGDTTGSKRSIITNNIAVPAARAVGPAPYSKSRLRRQASKRHDGVSADREVLPYREALDLAMRQTG